MDLSTFCIAILGADSAFADFLKSLSPRDESRIFYTLPPLDVTSVIHEHSGWPVSMADIRDALRNQNMVILDLPPNAEPPFSPAAARALCGRDTALVFRADPEWLPRLSEPDLAALDDVWNPLDDADRVAFRLRKLQELYATRKTCRLTQNWLDTTIDSVPDLIWFKDVRGAHLKVNRAFCNAVGKSKRQCEGRGHYYIWDLKREEYEKGEYVCLETEETVLRERKTCLFDEKVKSKNGLRQFKTYKSPLFDEYGEVVGTVGIARDVTDLKNMNAEMEILLRSMPYAILVRDESGRIIKANKKFEEYFHTQEKNVLGQDYATWKKVTLGIAPSQSADFNGNADIRLTFGNESRIIELHEEPVLDVFQTVVGQLCLFCDVTIDRTFEQKILHNANTDALTGLYNRRYFYQYIEENAKNCISLLYVDLDNFKEINDLCGHQIGDEALVVITRLLRESFPNGMIARVGGDEFLITVLGVCSPASLEAASALFLDKIRQAFGASKNLNLLSASIGITWTNDSNIKIDDLIKQSDMALYASKRGGKARYTIYTPQLDADLKIVSPVADSPNQTPGQKAGKGWTSKFRSRQDRVHTPNCPETGEFSSTMSQHKKAR